MDKELAQAQAFEAGFNRYLTKPMDMNELISTLLDLLEETRDRPSEKIDI